MSIFLQINDPVLSRMLLLESKRHGFREQEPPHILFAQTDTSTLPAMPPQTLCIGVCTHQGTLSAEARQRFSHLLFLPFSVREFENILYRSQDMPQTPRVERQGERLLLGGREIPLSRTERALFDLLYDNRHRTVSEAELNAVLGASAAKSNTLAVYLYRLRRKLCADGISRIRTVRGQGCRWAEPAESTETR